MALPADIIDGMQPESSGIGINLIPGNPPTFQIELQRAPDDGSGGPGTFATIAQLPPIAAASVYIDLLSPDNAFRHYRWRHIGPGDDPSANWSSVGRGKPTRLEGPAAAGGLLSFYPLVRGRPMADGKYALQATETDGSTKVSSMYNAQGAILSFVSPSPGTFFSYNTGGPGSPAGKGWASFGWSSDTMRRPDGTTVTVPAAPAAPAAPTLSEVAGGVLGARTRFARIAYVKTEDGGTEAVYPVSAESSFAISANNLLKVTSPSDPGGGLYSGWVVLVGSTASQNYVQGDPAVIAFGTDWTEPTGGFSTTENSRFTPSWLSITLISLLNSTQHFFYPYYHIAENRVRIPVQDTIASPTLAVKQNGDGALSLGTYSSSVGYSGRVQFATPASGSTGSGTVGGGRLT